MVLLVLVMCRVPRQPFLLFINITDDISDSCCAMLIDTSPLGRFIDVLHDMLRYTFHPIKALLALFTANEICPLACSFL